MKAVRFYGPGDIRVEEIAPPDAIGSDEVRLKVLAAGICGSDIHNFKTGQWISHLPVTPGHEFCGEVIELGHEVVEFSLGDIVVGDSKVCCGKCNFCRSNRSNLCVQLGFVGEVNNGGLAEQTVQPARNLLLVPRGVDPAIASLSEPLAVALHAVKRLAIHEMSSVLVAGGGSIGGLVALVLSALGHMVLLAELNDDRADLLGTFPNVKRVQLDHSALKELGPDVVGVPYCVEATGDGKVLERLVQLVAPGGRIAIVGLFKNAASLDFNMIVEREIDIFGCSAFVGEQRQALAMLDRLSPWLKTLLSESIDLDAIPSIYTTLANGGAASIKTIVKPANRS